jgi:hypothetical protein
MVDPPSPAIFAALLAVPLCHRLDGLTFEGRGYHDEHFHHLAKADLPNLTELRAGQGLTAKGAAKLAAANWLPQLSALDLQNNTQLGDAGLAILLDGPWKRLRSLQLDCCGLGGSEWAALAEHGPASLVHLLICHNEGNAEHLPRIGEGAYRLEWLCSNGNVYNEPDVAPQLFSSPALAGLRRLDWGCNTLGDDGVKALTGAPFREHLRILNLRNLNCLTDRAVRILCNGPPWPQLSHLDVSSHPLSPKTALALFEHPNFGRLVSLGLSIQNRADVFIKGLGKSSAAVRLRALRLDCQLTPEAVKALVEAPHLEGLDALQVNEQSREEQDNLQPLQDRFGPRLRRDPLFF